jgi:hypothetical protein
LDWTIGFIHPSLCNFSLNYDQYSAISELHNFQFTVEHALGFSDSTSRILATDLNIGTNTSNHYEALLPFLLQSPGFLTLYSSALLLCTTNSLPLYRPAPIIFAKCLEFRCLVMLQYMYIYVCVCVCESCGELTVDKFGLIHVAIHSNSL